MIHVVAVITTLPGRRAEVLEAFRAIVPTVHAEDGCIEYEPVIDVEDPGGRRTPAGPDTFIVIEKWASIEALDAHSVAPHMADYAAKVGDLIAGRVVHVLTAAPG